MTTFPKLKAPPIHEVVCGFLFDRLEGLTPVLHGLYWREREGRFVRHEVHPAVEDPGDTPAIRFGTPRLRTWLVTADETRLVQIQDDRLFVNWRRVGPGEAYPRFNARPETPGLLAFAIEEFRHFERFCEEQVECPRIRQLEMTKIDLLVQGEHWTDWAELARLIPLTAPLIALASGPAPTFALRFAESFGSAGRLVVSVDASSQPGHPPALRIETRARQDPFAADSPEDGFRALNERLNTTFFALASPDGLARFGAMECDAC